MARHSWVDTVSWMMSPDLHSFLWHLTVSLSDVSTPGQKTNAWDAVQVLLSDAVVGRRKL